MKKLKLVYTALVLVVLILIALIGVTGIYQSLLKPNESATFTSQALADVGSYTVFEYEILNREGRDTIYKVCTDLDGTMTCFYQPIENGKSFIYKRYIYPDGDKKKLVITVYKEDDPEPIEQATYLV